MHNFMLYNFALHKMFPISNGYGDKTLFMRDMTPLNHALPHISVPLWFRGKWTPVIPLELVPLQLCSLWIFLYLWLKSIFFLRPPKIWKFGVKNIKHVIYALTMLPTGPFIEIDFVEYKKLYHMDHSTPKCFLFSTYRHFLNTFFIISQKRNDLETCRWWQSIGLSIL